MKKISQWLKNRRGRRLNAFFEDVRKSTDAEKEVFLRRCVAKAYYPLYMAMVALEAPTFVSGEIVERTTGERFKVEIRKMRQDQDGIDPA